MEKNVDIAVIGAGSAGLFALSRARKKTDNYVLIDGGELGTTCARVGCMPSKVLIQVAEDFHRRHLFNRFGIDGHDGLSVDGEEVMEYLEDQRDNFVFRVLENSTDQMGEEFIEAHARFLEPGLLQAGDTRVRAKRVVIATGSRPVVPAAWQEFGDAILTTDTLFELTDLPASVAIIGLGVIGLELGQALHRLGVPVTGIDQQDTIAGLTDPVVAKTAIETLGREFPLWLGAPATIEAVDGGLRVSAGEHEVVVEKVLAAMGRRPNLDQLGLENLGIELDDHGRVPFNPQTMQIGDLPVFIGGDSTGDRQILHEATEEGRIAGFNACQDSPVAFKRKTPLAITFCDPNIVTVGKTREALDQDTTVVGEIRMGPVGRALIMAKNRGVLRVYADRASGKLLGAAMCCVAGEHLGHLIAWSIQQNMTVNDMLQMPYYHPVMEEALQEALRAAYRQLDGEQQELPELIRA